MRCGAVRVCVFGVCVCVWPEHHSPFVSCISSVLLAAGSDYMYVRVCNEPYPVPNPAIARLVLVLGVVRVALYCKAWSGIKHVFCLMLHRTRCLYPQADVDPCLSVVSIVCVGCGKVSFGICVLEANPKNCSAWSPKNCAEGHKGLGLQKLENFAGLFEWVPPEIGTEGLSHEPWVGGQTHKM